MTNTIHQGEPSRSSLCAVAEASAQFYWATKAEDLETAAQELRLARSTRDLLNTLAAIGDRNAGFRLTLRFQSRPFLDQSRKWSPWGCTRLLRLPWLRRRGGRR